MKTCLLQSFLLLFGITAAHGQMNLYNMAVESSDSLQKSEIGISPQVREEKTECVISSKGSGDHIASLHKMVLI